MSIQRDGAFEPLLAGVIAIRAKIFSAAKLETVEVWIGAGKAARLIEVAPVTPVTRGVTQIRLHVANIWLDAAQLPRSEEHTSELQSLMRISYAVLCLKNKKQKERRQQTYTTII